MIEEFSEYCIFSFLILSTCALAGDFRVSISFNSLYFTKSFDIDKLYNSIVYKVVGIKVCSFSCNMFLLNKSVEIIVSKRGRSLPKD